MGLYIGQIPTIQSGSVYIKNTCKRCGAPLKNETCHYCGTMHILQHNYPEPQFSKSDTSFPKKGGGADYISS